MLHAYTAKTGTGDTGTGNTLKAICTKANPQLEHAAPAKQLPTAVFVCLPGKQVPVKSVCTAKESTVAAACITHTWSSLSEKQLLLLA